MKQHGLQGAIEKFEEMLNNTPSLLQRLGEITNRVLLCHCETVAPCHGDVLIRAWERKFLKAIDPETPQEAAEAEELFQAAELRKNIVLTDSESEDEPGQAKRGWRGSGPPMIIGRGEKAREFHDGAGLCSLGRWPPESRKLPDSRLLSELRGELREYATPLLDGALFSRLACGKVNEGPFLGREELRETVYQKFEREGERPRKQPEENRSPLEFRLLDACPLTHRRSGTRVVELLSRSSGRSWNQNAQGPGDLLPQTAVEVERTRGPRGVQKL